MDNELIELARLMYNDPYSEIAPDILPQLCDALEAAQAENAQLRAENMNYAVNVCPEQDRIIAQLAAENARMREALAEVLRVHDAATSPDLHYHLCPQWRGVHGKCNCGADKAIETARAALEVKHE